MRKNCQLASRPSCLSPFSRIACLAVVAVATAALAIGQNPVTEQQPTGQTNPNSVSSTPNTNGTVPRNAGGASQTPSARDQALPGNSNPANAAAEGSKNGKAITPPASNSGIPGTSSGNSASDVPNGNDRSVIGGKPERNAKPAWADGPALWIILGTVVAIILINALARGRRPSESSKVVTMGDRAGLRREDRNRRIG